MSVHNALRFLGEARTDEALRQELQSLTGQVTWESLVELGARAGFSFSLEDLQRAHVAEWQLRQARYFGREVEGES